MTENSYIPIGRTSLIERNGEHLQLQTEFAGRPNPRITTTISKSGQVIHKIERNLKKSIESIEEQQKVERAMLKQHIEVTSIVKDQNSTFDKDQPKPIIASSQEIKDYPTVEMLTFTDRINTISGVQRIYQLDLEGNFIGSETSKEFQKGFSSVFKNLQDMIQVFIGIPSSIPSREMGVYEIEEDRLYLISSGIELYIVLVRPIDGSIVYEKEFRELVDKHQLAIFAQDNIS